MPLPSASQCTHHSAQHSTHTVVSCLFLQHSTLCSLPVSTHTILHSIVHIQLYHVCLYNTVLSLCVLFPVSTPIILHGVVTVVPVQLYHVCFYNTVLYVCFDSLYTHHCAQCSTWTVVSCLLSLCVF